MDYECIHSLLNFLLEFNLNLFICGDFNLRDSLSLAPLLDIIDCSECVQLVCEPTRENNMLDLIITNNSSIIQSCSVYDPNISDHCLTEINVSVPKIRHDAKKINVRQYKLINDQEILCDMNDYKWDISFLDPNDDCLSFMNNITEIFNSHAPIKSIRLIQRPYKKYISPETKLMTRERDIVYRNLKNQDPSSSRAMLDNMNSIIRRNIRRATRHELDNVIMKTSFWEGLHRLFPSATQNVSVFDSLSADEINDNFVSISTPQNASPYLRLLSKPDELNRFAHLTFNFREITKSLTCMVKK
jgi:hypothetical protein